MAKIRTLLNGLTFLPVLVLLLIVNWVCMWFVWEHVLLSALGLLSPYSALVLLIESSFWDVT